MKMQEQMDTEMDIDLLRAAMMDVSNVKRKMKKNYRTVGAIVTANRAAIELAAIESRISDRIKKLEATPF